MLQLLSIAGSLRAQSSHRELLHALALLAPPDVQVTSYGGIGDLPHFNPDFDREGDIRPAAVASWAAAVGAADGLLLSSPEYAHGVPGVMKNALDWLVSGPEFVGKPVALLGTSPDSTYARDALIETITTMSGVIVPSASIVLPLRGRPLDAAGIVADPELATPLTAALKAFVQMILACG